MDIGNFYFNTSLDRYEYMRINITGIPQEVIDEYKLYENNYVFNGCVYVEIRRALFRLKQSRAIANKQLSKALGKEGHFHSEHTSGLWLHKMRDISFTLVVNDFGVKYTKKEDVLHLKSVIDRALDWNYKARMLKASMPGYVKEALLQFQHKTAKVETIWPIAVHCTNLQSQTANDKHRRFTSPLQGGYKVNTTSMWKIYILRKNIQQHDDTSTQCVSNESFKSYR
jgi:hypothetical protein